jgi:hypothetical protein
VTPGPAIPCREWAEHGGFSMTYLATRLLGGRTSLGSPPLAYGRLDDGTGYISLRAMEGYGATKDAELTGAATRRSMRRSRVCKAYRRSSSTCASIAAAMTCSNSGARARCAACQTRLCRAGRQGHSQRQARPLGIGGSHAAVKDAGYPPAGTEKHMPSDFGSNGRGSNPSGRGKGAEILCRLTSGPKRAH